MLALLSAFLEWKKALIPIHKWSEHSRSGAIGSFEGTSLIRTCSGFLPRNSRCTPAPPSIWMLRNLHATWAWERRRTALCRHRAGEGQLKFCLACWFSGWKLWRRWWRSWRYKGSCKWLLWWSKELQTRQVSQQCRWTWEPTKTEAPCKVLLGLPSGSQLWEILLFNFRFCYICHHCHTSLSFSIRRFQHRKWNSPRRSRIDLISNWRRRGRRETGWKCKWWQHTVGRSTQHPCCWLALRKWS